MQRPDRAYPRHPRAAVGAVVFNRQRVLLVRRGHAPNHGQWAIPGGNIKLGETLQQAAEREILEETGIVIKAGEPVYTFDAIERDPNGAVAYHYVVVDVKADFISGEPRAGDDATDARWFAAHELDDFELSARTKELLKHHLGFGR
jgi:8-oxo-dGTP diphosphatase